MKILWIVNIILPEVSKDLNLPKNSLGGWLIGLSSQLVIDPDIELHIATVDSKIKYSKKINNIHYHILDNSTKAWKNLKEKINPDVVHIHGTEFDFGMSYMYANGSENVIFSIQGLLSVYERYYNYGITYYEIIKNITIRDILKRDNLFQAKRKFKKRGYIEKLYFKKSKYVLGRTDWDKAHAYNLNSNIKYYHSGEVLRNSFYNSRKWDYSNCEPYTIFLSQAGYPIKGLHQVIKAASILKKKFPKIKIKVAGKNIIDDSSFRNRISFNGYASYIKKLLVKNDLESNIEFLGFLSEEKILEQYLKANVFVCPSSIENSPNSLAEAQILGVPNISSFVGGVQCMVKHGVDGLLYRFEEIEMLAYYIDDIFSNDKIKNFYHEGILERHNPEKIKNELVSVYNKIILNKI